MGSADRYDRLAAEHRADELDPVRGDSEPGPLASLFPCDQPCLDQDRQMMTHCGLTPIQRVVEITGADLALRHRRDEAEQTKPHRIRQHLESGGEVLSLDDGQGLVGYRDTAASRFHEAHSNRLTRVDTKPIVSDS